MRNRPIPAVLLSWLLAACSGSPALSAIDASASGGSCISGVACDDGVACTENDVCDPEGRCAGKPNHDRCMDGVFCNGLEECKPASSAAAADGCVPGLSLIAEDDGIPCTESSCDESTLSVENVPGPSCECEAPGELCDATDAGDCTASECKADFTCERLPCDGLFADQPCVTGTCDDSGSCVRIELTVGAACDDGFDCTTDDLCESGGLCVGGPDDALCDDGLFCNGAEICGQSGCEMGVDAADDAPDQRACVAHSCDESRDSISSDDSLCGSCDDTELYSDADADGYGESSSVEIQCLPFGDPTPSGFATLADDCADDDPWRHPGAAEICFDFVDDDCDGSDTDDCEATTQPGVVVPSWDCVGTPPASVYAHAALGSGACFIFFSSGSGAMFGAPLGADDVTCGSWDQRLYAFTLAGETADCPPILTDAAFPNEIATFSEAELQAFNTQPVSNRCRKYLHQLRDAGAFSYVAADRAELDERIRLFPTLEIACLGYTGTYSVYTWQSLITGAIRVE